jgi:bacterioferritin-associated ferredoxin
MKKMVCTCHDLTEEDIEAAITAGYDDIETLKRLTGVTTGQCQGKRCMILTLNILARMKGIKIEETTKIRAPVEPIPLGAFVKAGDS